MTGPGGATDRAGSAAALDALAAELDAALPGAVARDVPAAELSTYRLGGPIAVLVRLRAEHQLPALADVVARHHPRVLVLGRGSNLLVADRGLAALGLVLEGRFEDLVLEPAAGRARAGAAVALPVLARRTAAAGLAGLEFYVGIPGSVGGAVRMNAGGHGRETADVLVRAWVADLLAGGEARPRSPEELAPAYRHTAIGPAEVVTAAEYAVAPDDPAACEARVADVVRWRREHQPGGANAGSVFRNPPGDSAGRIIDAAGCKGLRVGGAVVSRKHANFFQAEPGATAADVRGLVEAVSARVAERTGVRLVPELQLVGFDDVAAGS